MKDKIAITLLIVGVVFLFISFLTFYYVGVSFSECASYCRGQNWLADLSPLNIFTACAQACRRGSVPHPISIPLGQLGIILVVIALLKMFLMPSKLKRPE